jgi:hypothetical protein
MLRRPAFFDQHRIDDLACLGLGEPAATQELCTIVIVIQIDSMPFPGLDQIDLT